MLLFLHGPDSFRLHQRLQTLKQGFITKYDKSALNVEILWGDSITAQELRKAALTWGLLQERRLVIVRDIFTQKSETVLDECAEVLKELSDDSIVIFTATKLPKKKNNLLTQLQKADKVEEFEALKGAQLANWLRQKIKAQNVMLTRDAGQYLLQVFADDLWSLNNAVDKLSNYTDKITIKEIKEMIPAATEENIFDFTDALSAKDSKRALKLLHDQLELGANEFYLLSMLARQIKILWQVKASGGKGLDLHPFVVQKAMPQAAKFSTEKLQQLYAKLLDIDSKLKSSKIKPETLLDLWVIEACS